MQISIGLSKQISDLVKLMDKFNSVKKPFISCCRTDYFDDTLHRLTVADEKSSFKSELENFKNKPTVQKSQALQQQIPLVQEFIQRDQQKIEGSRLCEIITGNNIALFFCSAVCVGGVGGTITAVTEGAVQGGIVSTFIGLIGGCLACCGKNNLEYEIYERSKEIDSSLGALQSALGIWDEQQSRERDPADQAMPSFNL